MATPKTPGRQTTPQERTEQLRQQIAAREALQTLDTFEAADSEPASRAEDEPLVEARLDANSPGFGQTDVTEVTGDATFDEDLAEQAGNVENEDLAAGQATIDEYRSTRAAQVAALAPEEEEGGQKLPTFENRLGGAGASEGSSGGGSAATQTSGGGGGGGDDTNSNIVGGRGRPDELASGSESVSAAGGPQADMSQLVGDPRDLVQKGGGNSAASDSDAVHAALGAVAEEQFDTTTSKTSVANDEEDDSFFGGGIAGTVVGVVGTAFAAPAVGAAVIGLGGAALVSFNVVAAGTVGGFVGGAAEEEFGDVIHGVDSEAETAYKAAIGRLEGQNRKEAKEKGGGVRDPGPDDDRRDGPPTEAEQALRAATNKLLGRNDALVHGPATQIDPGEQGEVFQRGTTPLATSAERAEAMFGQPADPNARPAPTPDTGQTPPSLGPDGTEVLVEDGNPFTGGQRNDEDPQFGRVEPLIGLEGGNGSTDDDALPPEEEEDDDNAGKRSRISLLDDD